MDVIDGTDFSYPAYVIRSFSGDIARILFEKGRHPDPKIHPDYTVWIEQDVPVSQLELTEKPQAASEVIWDPFAAFGEDFGGMQTHKAYVIGFKEEDGQDLVRVLIQIGKHPSDNYDLYIEQFVPKEGITLA